MSEVVKVVPISEKIIFGNRDRRREKLRPCHRNWGHLTPRTRVDWLF